MYANREVFAQPPVVLVTAEVRFTDAPRLRQQQTLDAVAIAVDRRFPLSTPVGGVGVVSAGPGAAPQLAQRHGVVLRDAEGTGALTVTPSWLSYQTTDYRGFDAVQDVLIDACQTLTQLDVRPAVTRIGLRYVDEVRFPDAPSDPRGWSRWIEPALLAPLMVGAGSPVSHGVQGGASFGLERGRLDFRYSTLAAGATGVPAYLRRRPFTPGPFFALDFDGFEEFGADPMVFLDAAVIADVLPALHDATGSAFQRSITDEARALFRAAPSAPSAEPAGRHSI